MKNMQHTKDQLLHYLFMARKHAAIILIVFLLAVYGFLSWRTVQLLQAEPDPSAVSAQLNTAGIPKVDDATVNKMESLIQSNVSVHSLFDNTRSNPFQE